MSKRREVVAIGSKAERVTFFEDRAEVRRSASVRLGPGVHSISIEGVTLLVDDSSLVARITSQAVGNSRVLATRVRRRMTREPSGDPSEVAELERQVDATEATKTRADRESTQIRAWRERALAAEAELLEALQRAPRGVDDWREAFARFDASLEGHFDAFEEARHAAEVAERDVQRARSRWEQALQTRPRIASAVELQVEIAEEVSSDVPIEFELVYLTPCALWRPSHVAQLDTEVSPAVMRLTNEATVWQRTGEEWDDIEARFSTARPSRAVSAPLLEDDALRARPRQEMTVEGRDVEIEKAGATGARELDEMPGVDDGGEPLVLSCEGRVTIPSDGEPFRVEIGETELAAEVSTVTYPEYGATPHVRGRTTWRGSRPILAGPVRVLRKKVYVGVARLDFVAPGEILEMSFGRDSGVSVRRNVERESKTSSMTGARKLTFTVTLHCSNLSDQSRKFWVVERIPVSEVEEVKVVLVDAAGGALDDDGFLSFAIELLPHAVEKREISYRIEHGSSVNLRI